MSSFSAFPVQVLANPFWVCVRHPRIKGFFNNSFFWVSSHKIDRRLSHDKKSCRRRAPNSVPATSGKVQQPAVKDSNTHTHSDAGRNHPRATPRLFALSTRLSTSSLNYFAIYFNKFHIRWHYFPFPGPKINNALNSATICFCSHTHAFNLAHSCAFLHTHTSSHRHPRREEKKTWSQFKTENCPT